MFYIVLNRLMNGVVLLIDVRIVRLFCMCEMFLFIVFFR